MDRRIFLKNACAICGLALVPGLIDSCTKQSYGGPNANFTLDLSSPSNAALNSVGGNVTQDGVIVIRTMTGFAALSVTCTHQGCTVAYNPGRDELICPCHGGTYDINGNVVSGPPPSALRKYTVTQSGNILTVKS
jgi:cytochrome b6-f complex iron-sulfur subunit